VTYFYLVRAEGVDLSVSESHAFDVAKENVILCCLSEQSHLSGAMTEKEAQEIVNENYEQWSGFEPVNPPPPPPPTGKS
jgi:hypothetical protein